MALPLGPDEELGILYGMRREAESKSQIRAELNPQTAQKISDIRKKYPWLPPGVVLAAAKNNTSEQVLEDMAIAIAIKAQDNPEKANGKDDGNLLSRGFKSFTRGAFAAFDTSLELFQNALSRTGLREATDYVSAKVQQTPGLGGDTAGARQASDVQIVADAASRAGQGGFTDFLGSTTLASLVRNWDDQGSGYFVSEKIRQDQANRARAFRGTTQGGRAWTLGRGTAGMVFTEDSYAYNLMSGAVDGLVAVKMPIVPGAGMAASKISELAQAEDAGDFLRQAGRVADTLQGRGQIIKISDMTGEELREARRLAGIVGNTVDAAEANRFFATRAGRRLVERLVDANTVDDVWKLVGRNVYGDTVKRLRDAKNQFEVEEVLADILGKPQVGLASTKGVSGVRAVRLSNARRLKMMESLDGKIAMKIKRGLGYKPGRMLDFSSTNPADVRRTLQQVDNWAKTSLVDETTRRELLDEALDVMVGDNATPGARKAFKEKFLDTAAESLVRNGYTDEVVANVVLKTMRTRMQMVQKWALGPKGVPDDAGLLKNVARANGEDVTDAAFGGPMLASELADVVLEMPDPRQVRAISNRFNKLWRYKPDGSAGYIDSNLDELARAGTLKPPAAAIMWAQDKLFRRLVLMTGGYSVRNLTEAQLRIALSYRDIDGVFDHPASWLAWATHKKGAFDIKGEAFDYNSLSTNMRAFRDALAIENYTDFGNPTLAFRRGKRIGYYDEVSRGDPQQFDFVVEAHGDQLGLLNADPVARRYAAGASDEEVLTFIRTDPEGQAWFRGQQEYHMNGRPTYVPNGRGYDYAGNKVVDLTIEENLRLHLEEIKQRIEYQTGGDWRLKDVIAGGQLPRETLAIADQKVIGRGLNEGITKADEGQILPLERYNPGGKTVGQRQVRVESVNEETGEVVVRPFAFVAGQGEVTEDLNKLLRANDVYYNPKLAKWLPHEIRVQDTRRLAFDAGWDDMTDRAFAFLYGKPSRFLDRSPLFRQFYYEMAIDRLLTSLSVEDATKLHDNIVAAAAKVNRKPSFYVGGDDRWNRIVAAKNGELKMQGTLTLDEVDSFAKGQALDELKGLLYDATNVRNSVDAARVVFPFANAFVEFYKSIGRAYTIPTMTGVPLPNLRSMRKTQLVVEGGRDADPDQDGRGFFFMDPSTKEWSFTYPGSTLVTKALTGVAAPLTAPVAGVLQGIGLSESNLFGLKVNPGLGPMANIAASLAFSKLLPDTDFVRRAEKLFLPFGVTEYGAESGGVASGLLKPLVPAWGGKILSAIFDDPEGMSAFGNAAFETRQALIATGEYDLENYEDMKRLEADTNFKARMLVILRGIGQFTGPSRPDLDFKVKSLQGDVFINQVAADLRRWQEEDYDSAALRLLDTYGEDFWAYLARKTGTDQFEGLGATTEFGEWERANNDLMEQFPNIAGYFAPVGGDFDYFVYMGQIRKGRRERLSDYEAFNAAQYYSVTSQLRLAKKLIGDNPTAEQEQFLTDYRDALAKEYPGYEQYPFDAKKISNQIKALQRAAFVGDLDGNPVAEGARLYLQQRDAILAELAASGGPKSLEAKANLDYRNDLRTAASVIISNYPEFERLYERVLSRELD